MSGAPPKSPERGGANWFIARPLDAPELDRRLHSLPEKWRRVDARDRHLTLLFLGSCGRARALHAWQALPELEPPAVSLDTLAAAGPRGRPSAVVLTLAAGRELCAQQITAVRKACASPAGIAADTRAPWPHVTIARPRGRLRLEELARWRQRVDLSGLQLTLGSPVLFTRGEQPGPPRYRRVRQAQGPGGAIK